ncbi:MAG: hypothetical protein KF861_05455 [Planctomycetaceae bacterium]|nr:hypothetical protein [Planctomycetaceae bacterium]
MDRISTRSRELFRGNRRSCLLTVLVLAASGCGGDVYRQRLGETVSYFEYRDRIARELGKIWSDQGIQLQPPQQFTLVPAPRDASDEPVDPAGDPRQPHYLRFALPGLVAAWRAEVAVDTGSSQGRQRADLFVLSNHDWMLQQQSGQRPDGDPQEFITDFEKALSAAMGVYLKDGATGTGQKKNERYRETVPGGLPDSKYRQPQNFTAITFAPEVQPTDEPIEIQVYEWAGKKAQVVVVMVYPAGVSPRENLQNRLLLAMQTFSAADQSPRRPGSGSSGTGGRRGAAF